MSVGRRMGVGHPLGKVGACAKVFDFLLEGTLVPLLGTVIGFTLWLGSIGMAVEVRYRM